MEVLKNAKSLISSPDKWAGIYSGVDKHGVPQDPNTRDCMKRSVSGAIDMVCVRARSSSDRGNYYGAIKAMYNSKGDFHVWESNVSRTHGDIMNCFDDVIHKIEFACIDMEMQAQYDIDTGR